MTVWGTGCYLVGWREEFDARGTNSREASHRVHLTLSPQEMGRQARAKGEFIAPQSRDYPYTGAATNVAVASPTAAAEAAVMAAWGAARAQVLAPARISKLYEAYKASRKAPTTARLQPQWWGIPGQRGGARHTITGCLGEYQADALFHAMGHKKLSHGGKQAGLLDLPQGRGIDGIWRNKYPPPDYLITETKFTTEPGAKPKLSKGQTSDKWVLKSKRLEKALGDTQARDIQKAYAAGDVGKRLLHIDTEGVMTQYNIDEHGKIALV